MGNLCSLSLIMFLSIWSYGWDACSVQAMRNLLWCFQLLLAKTTRPYNHHRGIDESLFCRLQTSVQAFYTKAIEPQLHRTQSWRLSITVLVNGRVYLRYIIVVRLPIIILKHMRTSYHPCNRYQTPLFDIA